MSLPGLFGRLRTQFASRESTGRILPLPNRLSACRADDGQDDQPLCHLRFVVVVSEPKTLPHAQRRVHRRHAAPQTTSSLNGKPSNHGLLGDRDEFQSASSADHSRCPASCAKCVRSLSGWYLSAYLPGYMGCTQVFFCDDSGSDFPACPFRKENCVCAPDLWVEVAEDEVSESPNVHRCRACDPTVRRVYSQVSRWMPTVGRRGIEIEPYRRVQDHAGRLGLNVKIDKIQDWILTDHHRVQAVRAWYICKPVTRDRTTANLVGDLQQSTIEKQRRKRSSLNPASVIGQVRIAAIDEKREIR